MDYPSTRKEAKILNTKYYFTNKPCIRGHIDLRETNKGICKECRKIEWIKENERRSKLPKSEAAKESARRYYEKNKDLVKARAAARPDEEKNRWKKKSLCKNSAVLRSPILTALKMWPSG